MSSLFLIWNRFNWLHFCSDSLAVSAMVGISSDSPKKSGCSGYRSSPNNENKSLQFNPATKNVQHHLVKPRAPHPLHSLAQATTVRIHSESASSRNHLSYRNCSRQDLETFKKYFNWDTQMFIIKCQFTERVRKSVVELALFHRYSVFWEILQRCATEKNERGLRLQGILDIGQ